MVLWLLGYPDQALQNSRAALAVAEVLPHPYSLAMVHAFAASFHRLRREVQATQARAEAAVALSTTQEFPMWLAWGLIYRGWSLTLQGQGEEGILQIRQRLAGRQAIGGLEYPRYLALLAEAYGKAGRVEERLAALAAARAIMDTTGERL
jgi:hypothetical protein